MVLLSSCAFREVAFVVEAVYHRSLIKTINPLISKCECELYSVSFKLRKSWCLRPFSKWTGTMTHQANLGWGIPPLSTYLPSFFGDVAMVCKGGDHCERLSELLIWLFVPFFMPLGLHFVKALLLMSWSNWRSAIYDQTRLWSWLTGLDTLALIPQRVGKSGWLADQRSCLRLNVRNACLHLVLLVSHSTSTSEQFRWSTPLPRLCERSGLNYIVYWCSSTVPFRVMLYVSSFRLHWKVGLSILKKLDSNPSRLSGDSKLILKVYKSIEILLNPTEFYWNPKMRVYRNPTKLLKVYESIEILQKCLTTFRKMYEPIYWKSKV